MDDSGVGILAIVLLSLGGVIVLVAATGGIMYATDTPIGATVIDKECGPAGPFGGGGASSEVTVKTRFPIPGIDHTIKGMDNTVCRALTAGEDGNYAEYYLQSERTVLWRSEAQTECLYDSAGKLCS